jgi:hypothetical protein
MLSVSQTFEERKESPTLVVVTTAFQLALVVLVWLLALVPAAVAALTMLTIKTISRAFHREPPEGGASAF